MKTVRTVYWIHGLAGALILFGCASALLAQEIAQDLSPASTDHSHIPIDLPEDAPEPALSLTLYKDAVSGFNLEIHTDNFLLVPPPRAELPMSVLMKATVDPDSGYVEGHAHLYVNGKKLQRLYGKDVHLPGTLFHAGINQVAVTINNHGHMYWTVGGRQVIATLYINPDAKPAVTYRFESFPVAERSGVDD